MRHVIFLQQSQGGNYNPWFTWAEDSPKQQFHVLLQQPEPYCNSYLSPRWLIQRPSWREIQDYLEYQMAKERRSIMKKHTRLWSKFIWTISQPESRVDLCLKKHCSMFSRIAKCLGVNAWLDQWPFLYWDCLITWVIAWVSTCWRVEPELPPCWRACAGTLVSIFVNYQMALTLTTGFHLYSKRPRLGLGISLLCGYGDLDWD